MHPRKGIYRQYSEDEKAAAIVILKSNEGNCSKTSRETGIPPGTLNRWKHEDGYHPVTLLKQTEQRAEIDQRLERVVHELLDVVPDKYEDANLQQAMTSIAIAVDKMRLLREQATSITDKRQLESTDDQLFLRLRNIAQRLKPDPTLSLESSGPSGIGYTPAAPGTPPATD